MSPPSEPRTYFEQTGHRHVYQVKLPDTYVIAAEVKGIGGDPLALHKVRILDAATGEPVGDVLTTDENGVVRATVPKNAEYRIEILEDDLEAHGIAVPEEPEPALLRCQFVDPSGEPLPDHEVKVRFDDMEIPLTTDDDGRIEVSVHLGACQIEVGDQTFEAHAVTGAAADADEGLYRYIVGAGAASDGAEEEQEEDDTPEDRLERPELPPENEEELEA